MSAKSYQRPAGYSQYNRGDAFGSVYGAGRSQSSRYYPAHDVERLEERREQMGRDSRDKMGKRRANQILFFAFTLSFSLFYLSNSSSAINHRPSAAGHRLSTL